MKNSLFYGLFLLLMLTISSFMYAQQGGGRRFNMEPEEMAERQTQQMKESLELTEKQIPKVEALNLKYAKEMSAKRDEIGEDREAMRDAIMEIIKVKDAELKKIFTAEQWSTFEEERKKRLQNRRGGGGGRRGI